MYLSGESLVVILLAGLIAGWLAGKIVAGGGFGLIGNIAVGVVGALIGTWLLPHLGIHIGRGFVNTIIVATIGAVLLLLIVGLLSGTWPRRRWGVPWRRW
ncbi:MAG: GlsB/YeaQ/YmgE family stress response membrane protein [Alphaproteobacteria bacterium]|nr:GlsB/YeaQ/YmgE family stress response membrane protein [Alphaproteobacteria bacterium]